MEVGLPGPGLAAARHVEMGQETGLAHVIIQRPKMEEPPAMEVNQKLSLVTPCHVKVCVKKIRVAFVKLSGCHAKVVLSASDLRGIFDRDKVVSCHHYLFSLQPVRFLLQLPHLYLHDHPWVPGRRQLLCRL